MMLHAESRSPSIAAKDHQALQPRLLPLHTPARHLLLPHSAHILHRPSPEQPTQQQVQQSCRGLASLLPQQPRGGGCHSGVHFRYPREDEEEDQRGQEWRVQQAQWQPGQPHQRVQHRAGRNHSCWYHHTSWQGNQGQTRVLLFGGTGLPWASPAAPAAAAAEALDSDEA